MFLLKATSVICDKVNKVAHKHAHLFTTDLKKKKNIQYEIQAFPSLLPSVCKAQGIRPPLDSEKVWTGEVWSQTNLLK